MPHQGGPATIPQYVIQQQLSLFAVLWVGRFDCTSPHSHTRQNINELSPQYNALKVIALARARRLP